MDAPLILFGAFDRHNLGDILLAHVAAAEAAPRPVAFAGLAERDLTTWGGHRVHRLDALAAAWGDRTADLLHVGGEVLTCGAYEAAIMLQSPADAPAMIARLDADPDARRAWALDYLGTTGNLPYLADPALFRQPGRFEYRAVGGVGFARLDPASRAEAMARLQAAHRISVRDRSTLGQLAAAGIRAELAPDPVSRVADLFDDRIRHHAGAGEPAAIRAAHPAGYLALQCAAEYGDDASLHAFAAYLDQCLADSRPGLVLFRTGAAPWHDDIAVYRRLAGLLGHRRIEVFESLNVWDICALIAGAQAYCGSSLHGWIVAQAHGVARLPFPLPASSAKAAAYGATWPDRPRGLQT